MQQVGEVYSVGKQGRPAASPTSVLELDPVIANWSWESLPTPPVSQQTSPIRTSPLRSSMSSPRSDAMPQQFNSRRGAEGNNSPAGSRSLVETLQNCLTSLPQSNNNMGDSAGRSMSDPSGATSTTTSSLRQYSSRPPGKRRPRASRRTPTTILETNPSEFRDMVQKLTGIPTATPAAAPVRPHPQRASPNTFVRPETLRSIRRLPPISSPPRPPLIPSHITFLQHLQRNHTSQDAAMAPTLNPFISSCKRELPEESSSSPYGSHESVMKRAMSAPTTSMESWWGNEESRPIMTNSEPTPFTMSSSHCNDDALANEILSAGGNASPDFAGLDSADGQLAQEEHEFSFSQIESWLSAQDHPSTESMRG